MDQGFSARDLVAARWLSEPVFDGGELTVTLPAVLDGINSRLLRKQVLARLAECLSIRFDADKLNQLGMTGAATLWQLLTIAKRQNVHVSIINVTQHIHDSLLKIKEAEDKMAK